MALNPFLKASARRVERARAEEERLNRIAKGKRNEIRHEDAREIAERALVCRQRLDIEHQRLTQASFSELEATVWRELTEAPPSLPLILPLPPPTGQPVVLDPPCPFCHRRIKPTRFDYHLAMCRTEHGMVSDLQGYSERYFQGS